MSFLIFIFVLLLTLGLIQSFFLCFPLHPARCSKIPGLVPQFSTFDELVDKINTALAEQFPQGPVEVNLDYIEDTTGPDRVEVSVDFTKGFDLPNITFPTDGVDIGDLTQISVIDPFLSVDGSIGIQANFGVLLAPDPEEQLKLPFSPCAGKVGVTCPIDNQIEGRLLLDGVAYDFTINESTQPVDIPTTLKASFDSAVPQVPNDAVTITQDLNSENITLVTFGKDISSFEILFNLKCVDVVDGETPPADDIKYLTCPEGFKKKYDVVDDVEVGVEPLRLVDIGGSRPPFQIGIGKVRCCSFFSYDSKTHNTDNRSQD